MTSPSIHLGPSSWDRDMQGLDVDAESDNLAALGMHITGAKANDDDEEEEDEKVEKEVEKIEGGVIEPLEAKEEEKEKDEPEELDELKELDRLEKVLKEEDDPVAMVDDED